MTIHQIGVNATALRNLAARLERLAKERRTSAGQGCEADRKAAG